MNSFPRREPPSAEPGSAGCASATSDGVCENSVMILWASATAAEGLFAGEITPESGRFPSLPLGPEAALTEIAAQQERGGGFPFTLAVIGFARAHLGESELCIKGQSGIVTGLDLEK